MRKVTILFLIIFGLPAMAWCQSDPASDPELDGNQKAVMAAIMELFDGYRASDSARVSAVFTDNAQMQRITAQDGKTGVSPANSVQGWLNYIGSGLEQTHDEPIWNYTVHIDGSLASVWTEYAFYLDGAFHHCGVDAFLLVNTQDDWKIFHVVDTSREEVCNVPDAIHQKSGIK